MNSYAPHLFIRPDDPQSFVDCGQTLVDEAVDEIEVKAVYHPLTRIGIARRLLAIAEEELAICGYDAPTG